MSTLVYTGADLALTINSVAWTAQVQTCAVSATINRVRTDTLDGPSFNTVSTDYQLDVTMALDYGANGGLAQALTTAAISAPDTALAFVLTVTGADVTTVTGDVFPTVVSMTGTGQDIATATFTLPGDRNTPLAIATS